MFASWHILPFYTIFTSIKTSGSNKNYEISHKKNTLVHMYFFQIVPISILLDWRMHQ